MSDDSFPTIVSTPPSAPPDVQVDDTLKQMQHVDLQVANDMLKFCYTGFSHVKSITSLTRLIDSTLKVVESRRKILCKEYGYSNQNAKPQIFDPLD